jgi:hypothetical protein
MKSIALTRIVFLGAFTGTALAADAITPPDASLLDLARPIFDAVMHGQWWAAAALAVVMIGALGRKYMPDTWKTGAKGDIIGTGMAFVTAFAGAIATWALAPGAVMSMAVVLTALKIGTAAVGGYTVIHKVASWLVASGKLPPWALAMLKMVTMFGGSNAVTKAEAAGAAAVVAAPPTGMAGDTKITEVE